MQSLKVRLNEATIVRRKHRNDMEWQKTTLYRWLEGVDMCEWDYPTNNIPTELRNISMYIDRGNWTSEMNKSVWQSWDEIEATIIHSQDTARRGLRQNGRLSSSLRSNAKKTVYPILRFTFLVWSVMQIETTIWFDLNIWWFPSATSMPVNPYLWLGTIGKMNTVNAKLTIIFVPTGHSFMCTLSTILYTRQIHWLEQPHAISNMHTRVYCMQWYRWRADGHGQTSIRLKMFWWQTIDIMAWFFFTLSKHLSPLAPMYCKDSTRFQSRVFFGIVCFYSKIAVL